MKVRLHIGAHKTATTHLQDNLAAQEALILRHGWAYLPRPMLRQAGLLQAVFAQHVRAMQGQGPRLLLADMLKPPAHIPRNFILSEEDILGSSADLLTAVYPHARARLLAWAAVAPPERTEVFLAIRDYAGLLPSAYSQALRDGSPPPPFATCRAAWREGRLGWPDLVRSIAEVFGASQVSVWTMEHYLSDPAAVLSAFAGLPLAEVKRGAPSDTTRLSAALVRAIEALDPGLSIPARRQAAQRLAERAAPGPKFDPLTGDEKAALSARYRADIETIRALPVRFLG